MKRYRQIQTQFLKITDIIEICLLKVNKFAAVSKVETLCGTFFSQNIQKR